MRIADTSVTVLSTINNLIPIKQSIINKYKQIKTPEQYALGLDINQFEKWKGIGNKLENDISLHNSKHNKFNLNQDQKNFLIIIDCEAQNGPYLHCIDWNKKQLLLSKKSDYHSHHLYLSRKPLFYTMQQLKNTLNQNAEVNEYFNLKCM